MSPPSRSPGAGVGTNESIAGKPQGARCGLGRRNVLVDPEEVLGVIAPLELLQTSVFLGAVRLTDAILALVAEEVHVDARLVGLERRPKVPHPLPLLVEAVGGLGAGADVVREAGVAAAERGVILGQMRDRASHLPDREGRER